MVPVFPRTAAADLAVHFQLRQAFTFQSCCRGERCTMTDRWTFQSGCRGKRCSRTEGACAMSRRCCATLRSMVRPTVSQSAASSLSVPNASVAQKSCSSQAPSVRKHVITVGAERLRVSTPKYPVEHVVATNYSGVHWQGPSVSGQIEPKSKVLIVFVRRWAKDRGICQAATNHMSPHAWNETAFAHLSEPGGNNQTWQVEADFDTTFCDASINFKISGKPSRSPVSLTATL